MTEITLIEFLKCGAIISIDANHVMLGWGKRFWHQTLPTDAKAVWYAPDFFMLYPQPWFTHENYKVLNIKQLRNVLGEQPPKSKIDWHQPYEALFREEIGNLQKEIQEGRLRKGVPYVIESSPAMMTTNMLIRTLGNLLTYAHHLPVSIYGFWDNEEGMIGATPEKLFAINPQNPGIIETVALAGTNHRLCPVKLLSDHKERDEHQIVIEGMQTSLSKLGQVKVGETTIVNLATLSHLKTPIQVAPKTKASFDEIVSALHPTPALGAYPMQAGMAWLKAYQCRLDRSRYGAPFGFLEPQGGIAECLVAIRNMQWDRHGMRIGAGCGVVAESNVDKEWSEIQAKINAIKELLGL